MPSPLVLFEFSRREVKYLDLTRFLCFLDPEPLSSPELRRAANNLVLSVSGWDHDEREVYLIPVVRHFYQTLHKRWPYSLFFLNLDYDSLRILVFCSIQTLTSIRVEGRGEHGVQFDPVEVGLFLNEAFPAMNLLFERAGLRERAIQERTRAILEHFQLPFET